MIGNTVYICCGDIKKLLTRTVQKGALDTYRYVLLTVNIKLTIRTTIQYVAFLTTLIHMPNESEPWLSVATKEHLKQNC